MWLKIPKCKTMNGKCISEYSGWDLELSKTNYAGSLCCFSKPSWIHLVQRVHTCNCVVNLYMNYLSPRVYLKYVLFSFPFHSVYQEMKQNYLVNIAKAILPNNLPLYLDKILESNFLFLGIYENCCLTQTFHCQNR